MPHRTAISHGHPDRGDARLCLTLANAYAQGAEEGGHDVTRIEVAHLDFTLLSGKGEFEEGRRRLISARRKKPFFGPIV